MTLKEFYKSISNPLDDPEVMKKMFQAFSEGYSFYSGMTTVVSKEFAGRYNKASYDKLFARFFNTWKNNILSMTKSEFISLKNKGILSDEFIVLRNFLKGIPDVKTAEEVRVIKTKVQKDSNLRYLFSKYGYEISDVWTHIKSRYLNLRREDRINVEHRLYVNLELPDLHSFVSYFMDKCEERKLPYYFRFDSYGRRADTLVIYSSTELLMQYVEILREIAKEHTDMISRIKEPPILTGKVDGWFGYGSEPKETGLESFNTKRCDSIERILDREVNSWVLNHIDSFVRYGGKKISFRDYLTTLATDEVLDSFRSRYKSADERARKFNKPEEIERLGFTKEDLADPRFRDYIYNCIRKNIDALVFAKPLKGHSFVIRLRGGRSFTYFESNMNVVIRKLAPKIAASDSDFVSKVKEEIVADSINFGVDPRNYCFDVLRVNQMIDIYRQKNLNDLKVEFDSLIKDIEKGNMDRYLYDSKVTRAMEIIEIFREIDRSICDEFERRLEVAGAGSTFIGLEPESTYTQDALVSNDDDLDDISSKIEATRRRILSLSEEMQQIQTELDELNALAVSYDRRGKKI